MLIDSSHRPWIIRCGIIAVAATVIYVAYSYTAPNGPSAGSWFGLGFGFAGTAVIIFECLLSLRKKYPASPIGRVQTWLKGHIWLGLLSFLLILYHSGFSWGGGLAAALMWLFVIITVSGIYGLILQNFIPRRMTELVTRETVYDQIPHVVRLLRADADERIEYVTADLGIEDEPIEEPIMAGGKKFYFDDSQRRSAMERAVAAREQRRQEAAIAIDEASTEALKNHYLQETRPFIFPEPTPFTNELFRASYDVAGYFRHLRTITPVAAHEVLLDLESICEERRQLGVQARMHHWLHGWLFVHVPLSFAFLVLTLVHAVYSLRY